MDSNNIYVKEIVKHKTIPDFFKFCVENYSDNPMFCYRKASEYKEKTYGEIWEEVKHFSAKLQNDGYRGKKIAIVGATSYEWFVTFLSIMNAGATAVTLDKELDNDVLSQRIEFADAEALFYGKGFSKLADVVKDKIKCFDISNIEDYISFSGEYKDDVIAEELALICFTSGTTSQSKAVMLTQKNIASNAIGGSISTGFTMENSRLLAVLPMNHAFAVVQVFASMYSGTAICVNESMKYFLRDMQYYKPTIMLMVPLMINTIYKQIDNQLKKSGKDKLVSRMIKVCRFLDLLHIDIRKKVFAQILNVLGGNLKTIVSGGAYLDPDKIRYFKDLGITILQGYGITECSPVVSTNTDKMQNINSVGIPFPYNEIRVVDGEIQVKGDNVMKGYYKDEEGTRAAFDGEWFKTGDLGHIDDKGFIHITGRIKNLIILSNGENVVPEEIEAHIGKITLVDEVLVKEDSDKICAQIYLGENDSEQSRKEVKAEIAKINKILPSYSKIQKTEFRDTEFKKNSSKKIIRNAN